MSKKSFLAKLRILLQNLHDLHVTHLSFVFVLAKIFSEKKIFDSISYFISSIVQNGTFWVNVPKFSHFFDFFFMKKM